MSKVRILKNKQKIVELLNKNIDLQYNLLLKTFHKTYEKEANLGTKKEPKTVIVKIGCWDEWFKDEDKPNEKGVKIERQRVIEIDGKRSNYWSEIKYYTVDDL
jgi:hypothetical protein